MLFNLISLALFFVYYRIIVFFFFTTSSSSCAMSAAYDPVWSISVVEAEPPLIFVGRESGAFAKYSSTKLDLGPLLELRGHQKAVTGIALPSAEEALTASMDGTVRQWAIQAETEGKRDVKVITVGAPLRCALLLGETLLCGSTTGCIYAVPVATPGDGAKGCLTSEAQVPRWKGHSDAVVCLTQAEGLVLSGSYDNQARLWDAAGRCLCVFAGHTNGVKGVFIISPQFVLTAARDETVRLWAVPEGSGAGESEAPKAGEEEGAAAAAGGVQGSSKAQVVRPLASVAIPAAPHALTSAGPWVYVGSSDKSIFGINTKDLVKSVQDFYAENSRLYKSECNKTNKSVSASVAEVHKKTKRAIRKFKKALADEEKKEALAAKLAAKRDGRRGPADDDEEPVEEAPPVEEEGEGEEVAVSLSADRQEKLDAFTASETAAADAKIAQYRSEGEARLQQLEPISKLRFEFGKEKFYAASFTRLFQAGDEPVVAIAAQAKSVYYSNGAVVASATLIPGIVNL